MDLGKGIRKALSRLTGAALVDEKTVRELTRELQRVLITNDVNVKLVFELTKKIEERALKEKPLAGLTAREHVVKVVYEELQRLLGGKFEPRLGKQKILLLGLYGQGKTTTISKLAKFYQSKGLKVGVIAGDVHRPAAFEQLKQLAEQVQCGFYGEKNERDAVKVVLDAERAFAGKYDVLILDSAGRSAFDEELVKEIKAVNAVFKPDEKFLVVSADLGQVAGRQASEFNEAVGLTGVIITKMDGSGKGGGALSSVAVSGAPVAFIGTGEKPSDFEVFDSTRFVAQLCGFPDLPTLIEKLKEASDEELAERAMEEGKLDYESFLAQMRAMRKMGPLKQVMQMLGLYDLPEELVGQSEAKMKAFEAAVLSMTPSERSNPELMKSKSRQMRVARGAGLKPDEVRELVNNFEKANKMVKLMSKNRGMLKQLQKMSGGSLGALGKLGKFGGFGGLKP
ncbi:MAG: signal recognition particle receptor subunit alpha [Candidatus Norongarragalinales archaeon]